MTKKLKISIKNDEKSRTLLDSFKDEEKELKGIYVDNPNASNIVILKDNGDLVFSANLNTNIIMNAKTNEISDISFQRNIVTNNFNIKADNVTINRRRLNPKLNEWAEMKQSPLDSESVIGNFTMMGTVLVKAYDPSLKKYVLTRRLTRQPMFYPTLNAPDAVKEMSVREELTKDVLSIIKKEE